MATADGNNNNNKNNNEMSLSLSWLDAGAATVGCARRRHTSNFNIRRPTATLVNT
jgi:hypothetical protein